MRLLTVALLYALPLPASAQPWADAYQNGDYERAADLLHVVVTDAVARTTVNDDPVPARHLAVLYARGLGVEHDPIAACALAQWARMAGEQSAPRYASDVRAYERMIARADAFTREHCEQLADTDRLTASRSMGCFAFGMPEQVLELGRQRVRVGRHGITPADMDDTNASAFTDLFMCPLAVAGVRATSLHPPADAAPGVTARHFVEVFSWHRNPPERPGQMSYVLTWTAYEIRKNVVAPVTFELVHAADRWPRPGLPSDLDLRGSLQMIRSGHVRWLIAGDPPKRSWILLPEAHGR